MVVADLVYLGIWGLLSCLVALLIWRLTVTDTPFTRLVELKVSGCERSVSGSAIVVVSRWCNGRVGLLNHSSLAPGAGLLLMGSRRVHTLGMLMAIDVVFLDADFRVLAIDERVRPGVRVLRGPSGTRAVLEVGAGKAREFFGLRPNIAIDLTPRR